MNPCQSDDFSFMPVTTPRSEDSRGTECSVESPPSARPPHIAVGTARHFGWLEGIVKTVLVLNLLDAVLTLWWVHTGFAVEANPLISEIVVEHALLFISAKLALVSLGTWLLWRYRRRPLAVVGVFAAFLVYYGILLYHLSFASFLIRQMFEA